MIGTDTDIKQRNGRQYIHKKTPTSSFKVGESVRQQNSLDIEVNIRCCFIQNFWIC